MRDKVMYSEERIENFEAYFFRCYRYKEMTAMKQESRYTHPEDDFFLRFSDDEFSPSVKELDRLDRLVRDILRYLRDKFSTRIQDFHAEILWFPMLLQRAFGEYGYFYEHPSEENGENDGNDTHQQRLQTPL